MSDAPSLRETIESAMAGVAPEQEPAATAESVEAAPEVESPAPVETKSERVRDESGRFAKNEKPAAAPEGAQKAGVAKTAAAGKGKADGASPPPAPSAEPAPAPHPTVRAPQSWTPQAREAFAKAPPEVQREVERREREITRTLSETAQVRQFAQSVQQSLAPYETIARANGTDSMTWAGNALQMVASLYAGTPQQRAQTIARAIQMSGADLDAINQALQGQPMPEQPNAAPQVDIQAEIDRRFQAIEAQRTQQANHDAAQAFLETKPEFIEDVMPDMVEILRLDRAKGGNMTPQQAYDRACKYNEGVQSVLSSRKAAEAARANAPTVQRSKAAAVSIKPSPVAAQPRATGSPSLRETIEAAVAGQRIG